MRYPLSPSGTALLRWLARRPRAAALAAVILVGLSASLIRPPVIEPALFNQISGTNDRLAIARQIQAATGDLATAAVIVAPVDASIMDVFADLAALRDALASAGAGIELRSVDAVRDQLFLFDLSGAEPIQQLLGILLDDNEAATIVSADASRFLLVVRFASELEGAVLDVLSQHNWASLYSEHHVLARSVLEKDIAASLMRDLRLLIPVIVISMLLALLAAFGQWRALLLPLFASVAATIITFALFSVFGITINLVTLLALPIVLVVGLANSCHFLAKSGSAAGDHADIAAAVAATLRRVGPPFFYSSLTTSIALASLGLNDVEPIADLGRISAIALLSVFVLVMLMAPLALGWYLQAEPRSWQHSRGFAALSRVLAARRDAITAALLLAMLGGAMTVPLLSVTTDPRAFFPDGSSFMAAQNMFERDFYVYAPFRVLIDSGDAEPLDALRQAGVLREEMAALSGVRGVSIQPAVDSKVAYVLSALLREASSLAPVVDHVESVHGLMPRSVSIVYSSPAMVYADVDRQAVSSLLQSLGWSVALIFGAMLLVFRSLRAVLCAMLANAVPLLIVCGAVWLARSPLNLVTIFVFLVALGVIVDDAIHILFSRVAGNPLSGSSIEFSVLLSTMMLCLGLLLWQLSDFPTTREFAAWCALALVGAVISNLSVLPEALRWSGAQT